MSKYNLSMIFYPQDSGGYSVVCPELQGCVSHGDSFEEAKNNISEIIPDFLSKELESDAGCDIFAEGLTMKGKIFREVEVEF